MAEVTYIPDQSNGTARFLIHTAGPVNTIGRQFLSDLERAIDRAESDLPAGIILASTKKKSFLDGANLQELITDGTLPAVRSVLHRFHDAMARLAKAPFPVVGVLDAQTALGGGFEALLWACDHVCASPGSRVGLPEVTVGLFPAGGGTQTFKRVVGFRAALDSILTGRTMQAEDLVPTGLVSMCDSQELIPRAEAWIASHPKVVNRNYDPNHGEPDRVSEEEKHTLISGARARHTISPCRPNLAAAIDAIEAGISLPFEEALRREIDLFVPLFAHTNTRNKMDLFFLVTSRGPRLAKVDSRKAIPASEIAVIGGGLMGQGIAQVAADKGIKATIVDMDEERSHAAVDAITETVSGLVAKGRWSETRRDHLVAHLHWTTDYQRLRDIPLIIECVFEDPPLKQEILKKVHLVNPQAVFASNTSTIPMADISHRADHPEQVVGMHFFSPVPLMPLLEVVEGPATSAASLATAVTLGRTMGKTVIIVGDGPGFYTSRTFGHYVLHGFHLAELGLSPWDVDMLAMQAGFPQGPLNVYGTAGGNVVYHASRFMAERLPERVSVPESLTRLFEAGYVGAGQPSFYLDPGKLTRDESVLQHLIHRQGLQKPTEEEAGDILLLGMVNEAFWCLSDGVLRDYYSMELGAALGIGFPDCLHGPARYAGRMGIRKLTDRLAYLADKFELPSLNPAPEFTSIMACGLDSHLV
jgi:3-hydroxyacyl-CoA dehydrogenase/enoyl-CoA hydratase/3-hydroxybutyryl-CoA epimerase